MFQKEDKLKTGKTYYIKFLMAIDYGLLKLMQENNPYQVPDVRKINNQLVEKLLHDLRFLDEFKQRIGTN